MDFYTHVLLCSQVIFKSSKDWRNNYKGQSLSSYKYHVCIKAAILKTIATKGHSVILFLLLLILFYNVII